jgi:hypothetical protein
VTQQENEIYFLYHKKKESQMLCTKDSLQRVIYSLQEEMGQIEKSITLEEIVATSQKIGKKVAINLAENILQQRAQEPTIWGNCSQCGHKLHSKGFVNRAISTGIGKICWQRRVGRCANGCNGEQQVPFDQQLGITAYQKTSIELKMKACMLAVFMPFSLVALFIEKLLGVDVSESGVWKWIQQYGCKQKAANETSDSDVVAEEMNEQVAKLPLLIGADGVKVPFRPNGGSPKGSTVWQEVKVAVLTRLATRLNKRKQQIQHLQQRRLVAVLGSQQQLAPLLWREALRQRIHQSSLVVWISDGGVGFWSLFQQYFSNIAIGILDFYHAAQNLWKGAAAWLDGRTSTAKEWFVKARHELRHGSIDKILVDLMKAQRCELSEEERKIIQNLYKYLDEHRQHTHYSLFKDVMKLPIGSGVVESACKWLIAQRFKGVGMRWSETGFSNLLELRLAWVNGRFEKIYSASPNK